MFITVTHCSLQQQVQRVCVDMHRGTGGWRHGRGIAPLPFQKGATGAEVPFHNSIISIDLKQIYCRYSGIQKIQNDFL